MSGLAIQDMLTRHGSIRPFVFLPVNDNNWALSLAHDDKDGFMVMALIHESMHEASTNNHTNVSRFIKIHK